MESVSSLKDYLISDEIQRIQLLTKEELVSELIDVKSRAIESLGDEEVFEKIKNEQG